MRFPDLSELTGQTIPVGICISLLFNQHYPARSVKLYIAGTKEMVLSKKKTVGESLFHRQNDWSVHGPADQF